MEQSTSNRVVIRSDIVHCPDGQEPRTWGKPYSYLIDSKEPAPERLIRVGEEWQPLDFGWVSEPSMLFLKNSGEGDVDIAVDKDGQFVDFAVVRAGRDAHFEPVRYKLYVRCRQGETSVYYVAVPR